MDATVWTELDVKVALALVLIRNKPEGISAKEYAEMIQQKLQSDYSRLRQENIDRGQQLFRLKEQMVELYLNQTLSSSSYPSSSPSSVSPHCIISYTNDCSSQKYQPLTLSAIGNPNSIFSNSKSDNSTPNKSCFNYTENLLDAYLTVASAQTNSATDEQVIGALSTLLNLLLVVSPANDKVSRLAMDAVIRTNDNLIKKHQQVFETFWSQLINRSILDGEIIEDASKCDALEILRHVVNASIDGCHLRLSVVDALLGCIKQVSRHLMQVTQQQSELNVNWWLNSVHLFTLLDELLRVGPESLCQSTRQHCSSVLHHLLDDCLRNLLPHFALFVHVICQLNDVAFMTTANVDNYAFINNMKEQLAPPTSLL